MHNIMQAEIFSCWRFSPSSRGEGTWEIYWGCRTTSVVDGREGTGMEGWGPNDVKNYMKAPIGRICRPAEVPPTGVGLISSCHPGNGGSISVGREGPLGGVTPEPLPQN